MPVRKTIATFVILAASTVVSSAQTAKPEDECFASPTKKCLVLEAISAATAAQGLGVYAAAGIARVARAASVIGQPEVADSLFDYATNTATKSGPIPGVQSAVVIELFKAGRLDAAIPRTRTVSLPGVAEAAVPVLIKAGRLADAEEIANTAATYNQRVLFTDVALAYVRRGDREGVLRALRSAGETPLPRTIGRLVVAAEGVQRLDISTALQNHITTADQKREMNLALTDWRNIDKLRAIQAINPSEAIELAKRVSFEAGRPALIYDAGVIACKNGNTTSGQIARSFLNNELANIKPAPLEYASYLRFDTMLKHATLAALCKDATTARTIVADVKQKLAASSTASQSLTTPTLINSLVMMGDMEQALAVATSAKNTPAISRILAELVKNGKLADALNVVRGQSRFDWPDLLSTIAESMP